MFVSFQGDFFSQSANKPITTEAAGYAPGGSPGSPSSHQTSFSRGNPERDFFGTDSVFDLISVGVFGVKEWNGVEWNGMEWNGMNELFGES